MAWIKVSDDRWERPVDGLEGYYSAMASVTAGAHEGRENYTIFSTLKLKWDSPDITSSLEHAWKQMRFEQPQLATTIEGSKKVYRVPDETTLQEWLASTFIVSPASSAEELYQSISPFKQATLYYLPRSSELVVRAHHYTIDGTGIILFWHSYLSALAAPKTDIRFGDEQARLAPVMEDIFGFSASPTQAQMGKANALFMSYVESVPGICPVTQTSAAGSGTCQNAELVFSIATTEALINACKEKNISVTAAIHAAYIKAIEKHADPQSKVTQYATAAQFNLRPYLPEPYNSCRYGVSVYFSPLPYVVNLPASYGDLVQSLQQYYKTSFKENPGMLELKGHFTNLMFRAVQSPEFFTRPAPRDAMVSSLGILERHMQTEYDSGIKVVDLKIGIDVVVGTSAFLFYTFREQLRFNYCFNDGFEKLQDIETYLEETKSILTNELGAL
ncbi:hypothetical protein S40293_08894 [Stachybotrys chartarum IBT 40293]|nr:hypothetical protein S40293_08894 [Stachybotrys chartarum IBT 40293]